LQLLELIIFAGLAAIVLYQLYSVLGRRVGRQPGEPPAPEATGPVARPADRPLEGGDEAVALTGVAAVRSRDPGFEPGRFLAGARSAYDACERAILTHGGYGYAKEFHVERFLREVMIARIAPVSEQLILCYVAERALGLPKSY